MGSCGDRSAAGKRSCVKLAGISVLVDTSTPREHQTSDFYLLSFSFGLLNEHLVELGGPVCVDCGESAEVLPVIGVLSSPLEGKCPLEFVD